MEPKDCSVVYEVRLPNGLYGRVRLQVKLFELAQNMAWKAYYTASKKSTSKGGAVRVALLDDGMAAAKAWREPQA